MMLKMSGSCAPLSPTWALSTYSENFLRICVCVRACVRVTGRAEQSRPTQKEPRRRFGRSQQAIHADRGERERGTHRESERESARARERGGTWVLTDIGGTFVIGAVRINDRGMGGARIVQRERGGQCHEC